MPFAWSIAMAAMVATSGVIASIAQDGERWFYRSDGQNGPMAVYGPPDAGGYVILSCGTGGLDVSLMDVDPHPARTRAIVTSGNQRFETATVFGGDAYATVEFTVPFDAPIMANLPRDGFAISFRNGERNSFPGDAVLGRLIRSCQR